MTHTIHRIILISLFFCSFKTVSSQTNNKNCQGTRSIKDLRRYIDFCQRKFNSLNYFTADSLCVDCLKRDFKKFELFESEKVGKSIYLTLKRSYYKKYFSSYLFFTFHTDNHKSASISFLSYPMKHDACLTEILGNPFGYNSDSSSLFWKVNERGFFESRINKSDLSFYTKDYQDIIYGFSPDEDEIIKIDDRIIIDSLPKLPYLSVLLSELLENDYKNDYFYQNNIFSNEKRKMFDINFFKFCKEKFDSVTNESVLHQRKINDYISTIDSLKTACFKNKNLFRGSSIEIFPLENSEKLRINSIKFTIHCGKRPYDTVDSNKKQRILETFNYLINGSKLNYELTNVMDVLKDFIDIIDINREKTDTIDIDKDNYRIHLNYRKNWLSILILMPKSFHNQY